MRKSCLLIVAMLALAGCEGYTDPGPAGPPGPPGEGIIEIPEEYTNADALAGGLVYWEWWRLEAGGEGSQPPTWAPADFYRCVSCHAWDGLGNAASYADRTGQSTLNPLRPDVSSVSLRSTVLKETPRELFDLILHVGSRKIDAYDNTHPDYSEHLTDSQVWNLVKFMREEWIAPNMLYDIEVAGPAMYVDYSRVPPVVIRPTVTYSNVGALGNEADGQALFAATCSSCHGQDGTARVIEGRSLGKYVREKPYELWSKPKFGNPNGGMPSRLVMQISDFQDLYKALSNPNNFPDP